MTLTSRRVEVIYTDSLYVDADLIPEQRSAIDAGGVPDDAIVVEGIMFTTAFDPVRLEPHRAEIIEMLHELPNEFLENKLGGGGGWSFLNACLRNDGEQWTGFHRDQDCLVQLGIAVGAARWLLDRKMWDVFPGGMPYFVVTEVAE